MELLLAIDMGTSYFKLGLFDRDGNLRGLGKVRVVTDGQDGRRELPTDRFWGLLREGLNKAVSSAGAVPSDIQGVSYGSQANSFVLLDEADVPLTPLILWPDQRGKSELPALAEISRDTDFMAITGLGIELSAEFAAAKLLWIRRHDPQLWRRVRRIASISDYLVLGLTGQHKGDSSTTSLTGLWDVAGCKWWTEGLEKLCLAQEQFCSPQPSGTLLGRVMQSANERLPLPAGVAVAAGSLDHHAAALGAGVGALAPCSESTGTVLACVSLQADFRPSEGTCTGPASDGSYYSMSFEDNGAASLEWYQRKHAPGLSIDELLRLAKDAPRDADGLVALPCANRYDGLDGFRHRKPSHGHGHYVRAVLASTADSLAALVDRLCPTGKPGSIVATGGGASSDLWLQMKADRLGVTMIRPACPEPACLGAAMFAAVAVGWYARPIDAAKDWAKMSCCFYPKVDGNS